VIEDEQLRELVEGGVHLPLFYLVLIRGSTPSLSPVPHVATQMDRSGGRDDNQAAIDV